MSPTRENLHAMLDIIDVSEIDFLFHMMTKLLPEDMPLPDEIEAIRNAELTPDDYIPDDEIDWNNLSKYA
ncbi:MAG: hypothetical protein LBL93_05645 [Ruminococcus sp.]|jgi:hypothetical protein|nr:hypothetical protein [Ruminococcus sp.]